MDSKPQTLTATVEGRFGIERTVVLVRQPDGHYVEANETRELPTDSVEGGSCGNQQARSSKPSEQPNEHDTHQRLTAKVQGQFGEDHEVVLVRQPDGKYRELADPAQALVL
ncbi:MAG TPA: hypothetical protein PLL20_04310 [Phycisphaerae bacterium]|jgi:hypothetical protein|nr:hypothetical protein [Phycisphaerae bacterium]HRR85939.1 hypothetical protein [Phycisphaerae bacterium]